MEASGQRVSPPTQRSHRKLSIGLIVVAAALAFLATFSIWANRQLLETDNWVETSTELLEDEAIRTELSTFITDTRRCLSVEKVSSGRAPRSTRGRAGRRYCSRSARRRHRKVTDDARQEPGGP